MNEKVQKYICKLREKETADRSFFGGYCASCKLIKMKISYLKRKVGDLNQFELNQQIKYLNRKETKDTDSSNFSDKITEDDNSGDDPDFIAFSVTPKQ